MAVANEDVHVAIAVKVAQGHCIRGRAASRERGAAEAAHSVIEEHLVCCIVVADDHVKVAVTIQVGQCN